MEPTSLRTGAHLFLIAGEASGDLIGSRLMEALQHESATPLTFSGIGGPEMTARGLNSLFDHRDLSLLGLIEILPHLPRLLRRLRETEAAILNARPAAVIGIDASAFTQRLARRLRARGAGIPLIQVKAPSAWAYLPGRARSLARTVDRVLTILPFEPAFFAAYGIDAPFIGHPALESGADRGDAAVFRNRYAIPAEVRVLAVLPGSRRSEITRLAPVFGAALDLIARRVPDLFVILPAAGPVATEVRDAVSAWPIRPLIVPGEERYDAFAAAQAALAASGTVSVELAMAATPMVIAYRTAPLTAAIARRILRIRYATIANLVLDREAVPERIQENCTPEALASAILPLLTDVQAADSQRRDLAEAVMRLRSPLGPPSEAAARLILETIAVRRRADSEAHSIPPFAD